MKNILIILIVFGLLFCVKKVEDGPCSTPSSGGCSERRKDQAEPPCNCSLFLNPNYYNSINKYEYFQYRGDKLCKIKPMKIQNNDSIFYLGLENGNSYKRSFKLKKDKTEFIFTIDTISSKKIKVNTDEYLYIDTCGYTIFTTLPYLNSFGEVINIRIHKL